MWKKAASILKANGFDCYLVGGAVRDLLLNKNPKDYDLVTNGSDVHIETIFKSMGYRTKRKGKKFGVISVYIPVEMEISSYRSKESGEHSKTLEEDLFERDFTINAIAMDIDGNIHDPTGGVKDLEAGLIRTTKEPNIVFSQDPLRMFRAIRLATQLDFSIDYKTYNSIKMNKGKLKEIPIERVVKEMDGIITSQNAHKGLDILYDTGLFGAKVLDGVLLPEVLHLKGLVQNPKYHKFDVWGHTLEVVKSIEKSPKILPWSALLHDIGKGLPGVRGINKGGFPHDIGHEKEGAYKTLKIAKRLKFSKKEAKLIHKLVLEHMIKCAPTEKSVKKWLNKLTTAFKNRKDFMEFFNLLMKLRRADAMGGRSNEGSLEKFCLIEGIARDLLKSKPFFKEDLPITSEEIAALKGIPLGPWIKYYTRDIIKFSQNPGKNKREEIIKKILGER